MILLYFPTNFSGIGKRLFKDFPVDPQQYPLCMFHPGSLGAHSRPAGCWPLLPLRISLVSVANSMRQNTLNGPTMCGFVSFQIFKHHYRSYHHMANLIHSAKSGSDWSTNDIQHFCSTSRPHLLELGSINHLDSNLLSSADPTAVVSPSRPIAFLPILTCIACKCWAGKCHP